MLRQLDALRVHLAFSLPHELRTPLDTILGFSRLLVTHDPEQWPDAEKMLQMHDAIYHSALRLQRLIDNYLLYANLRVIGDAPEQRHGETWQRPDVLESAAFITPIALFAAKAEHRQDDLNLSLSEADILFSRKSLQKILEELLDNALKFSEPGTPVHVVSTIEEQHWRLRVIDRGHGMTAEHIAGLSDFMQCERERYAQPGSGLGLSIARLLAQINDSELRIESTPGQGTQVCLDIATVSHSELTYSPAST